MKTERTVQVSHCNHYVADSERVDPSEVVATSNAEPSGRLLNGSEDGGYACEWQEPATMPDGRPCLRMYLFTDGEYDEAGDEADELPWDDDHIVRIILIDW